MFTIGVISDTHIRTGGKRCLPPRIFETFSAVDLILHAGDLNTLQVITELETLAPVLAVHGNNCDWATVDRLPATRRFTIEGCTLGLVHGDVGVGGDTTSKALSHFSEVDCVVFGHSHWPLIQWKGLRDRSVLLFNPGSATDPRHAPHPSCGILRIDGSTIEPELVTW